MNAPASHRTYGREQPKTDAEKNKTVNRFFDALKAPESWKFLGWRRVSEPESGRLLSVGAVFSGQRVRGQEQKDYLVCFVTAPERGAVCEKTLTASGDAKYTTVVSNLTVEKMNEFIKERYEGAGSSDSGNADGGLDALRKMIEEI